MSDAGILSRAAEVVGRFPSRRVLVVGDIMLDEYVFGTVGRISPEAPVPVVAVTRETKVPGGAANVAFNLRGLGAGVEMAGLLGDDAEGRFVARMLKGKRVGTLRRGRGPGSSHHGQDAGDRPQPAGRSRGPRAEGPAVPKDVRRAPAEGAGRPRRGRRRRLLRLPEGGADRRAGPGGDRGGDRKGIFVAVDPKRSDFSFYRGCTIITPNKGEAQAALGGRELATDLDVWEAGKVLLRAGRSKAVLITRGEEGMTLVERGRSACFHVPAFARQVFDVTGAGDTVIGTLAACLAAGATMREAAVLANVAASVVVGEVGTSPITAEKLLRAVEMCDRPASPRASKGKRPCG